MGIMSICAFKAKPGKEEDLMQVTRDHLPILQGQGLVTDRPNLAMMAEDGTIIEVFEWKSEDAIREAHQSSEVRKLWARYDDCCECLSLNQVPESAQVFPGFRPIDL